MKNQKLVSQKIAERPVRQFQEGEEFIFLGEAYTLRIVEQARPPLHFDQEFRLSKKHQHKAQKLLVRWYREQAFQIIHGRTTALGKAAGLEFESLKIRDNRQTWGSCSGRANLSFNWRLVMAPQPVIDYVIIHELSHLEHRNHSKRFWRKVEQLYPDYRVHRKWLKENGHTLNV